MPEQGHLLEVAAVHAMRSKPPALPLSTGLLEIQV